MIRIAYRPRQTKDRDDHVCDESHDDNQKLSDRTIRALLELAHLLQEIRERTIEEKGYDPVTDTYITQPTTCTNEIQSQPRKE